MTACTNKGGKAGRVITAALVATLSVGAPVVALATTADAAAGDVQLMAATADDAFNAGTVAEYKVGEKTVEGNEAVTIKYADLSKSEIQITKVTPDGKDVKDVDYDGTTYYYKETKDGSLEINGKMYEYVGSWEEIGAGNYIAAACKGEGLGTSITSAPVVSFTVVTDSLEGAKLMKNVGTAEDPEYTDEITYAYGQKWSDLKVVIDDIDITDKVRFEVYEKGTAGNDVSASGVVPGTYEVVIKGNDGGVYQGSETKLEVSVAKLDLSTLDLYIDDVTDGKAPTIASVKGDGVAVVGQNNLKALSFSETDKTWGSNGAGEYVATLSVPADNAELSARFTGTATIKYNRLAENAKTVTWKYDTVQLTDGMTVMVDPSQKDNIASGILSTIDPTKFSGTYGDDDTKLTAGQYTVKLLDADGNEVTDLNSLKKGDYKLVIEAVPSALEYKVQRSTVTINVTYRQGTIGTAGTTFTYDGKVVKGEIEDLTYDGTDKLDKLGIQVKSGDKTLVEGTDYTVKVTKKVDNKDVEVTEAVDAGEYTVTVSSDTYAFESGDEVLTFEIGQFALNTAGKVEVEFPTEITYEKGTYVPYTGEAISPVVKVALTTDENDELVWTELDASDYVLSFEYKKESDDQYASVKEMKELGYYKVTVTAADDSNYSDETATGDVKVSDEKVFVDVENDAWYAASVGIAQKEGYVFGVNNSNVFMPEASINRADVVCVIYRMAGGTVQGEDWVGGDFDFSTITKYSDVDGKAYYAEALAWATKVGIVTGYEDGTFGPGNAVTAEEFATMLARYAKIAGTDTSVEDVDAVLGSVADGAQVSDFAREAVAWAVESGYMAQGSDIVPQSEVSRGRMVTIAVRYQPAQADLI